MYCLSMNAGVHDSVDAQKKTGHTGRLEMLEGGGGQPASGGVGRSRRALRVRQRRTRRQTHST